MLPPLGGARFRLVADRLARQADVQCTEVTLLFGRRQDPEKVFRKRFCGADRVWVDSGGRRERGGDRAGHSTRLGGHRAGRDGVVDEAPQGFARNRKHYPFPLPGKGPGCGASLNPPPSTTGRHRNPLKTGLGKAPRRLSTVVNRLTATIVNRYPGLVKCLTRHMAESLAIGALKPSRLARNKHGGHQRFCAAGGGIHRHRLEDFITGESTLNQSIPAAGLIHHRMFLKRAHRAAGPTWGLTLFVPVAPGLGLAGNVASRPVRTFAAAQLAPAKSTSHTLL